MESSIIKTIFAVFTEISEWIVSAVQAMTPIFYSSETGITFLGTMSLCGLGIGVILLIFNIVRSIFRFA